MASAEVSHSNSSTSTVDESFLGSSAEEIVQKKRPSALTVESVVHGYTCMDEEPQYNNQLFHFIDDDSLPTLWCIAELSAGNVSIKYAPGLITDSSPCLVPADFHSTDEWRASVHESEVSILTERYRTKLTT